MRAQTHRYGRPPASSRLTPTGWGGGGIGDGMGMGMEMEMGTPVFPTTLQPMTGGWPGGGGGTTTIRRRGGRLAAQEMIAPPPPRPRPTLLPCKEIPPEAGIIVIGMTGTGKSRTVQRLCWARAPSDGIVYYAGSSGAMKIAKKYVRPCFIVECGGEDRAMDGLEHLQHVFDTQQEWDKWRMACGLEDAVRVPDCLTIFDDTGEETAFMKSKLMRTVCTQGRHTMGWIAILQQYAQADVRMRNSAKLVFATRDKNPQSQKKVWEQWFRAYYPNYDDYMNDVSHYAHRRGSLVYWDRGLSDKFEDNIYYFPNEDELPMPPDGWMAGAEDGEYAHTCQRTCEARARAELEKQLLQEHKQQVAEYEAQQRAEALARLQQQEEERLEREKQKPQAVSITDYLAGLQGGAPDSSGLHYAQQHQQYPHFAYDKSQPQLVVAENLDGGESWEPMHKAQPALPRQRKQEPWSRGRSVRPEKDKRRKRVRREERSRGRNREEEEEEEEEEGDPDDVEEEAVNRRPRHNRIRDHHDVQSRPVSDDFRRRRVRFLMDEAALSPPPPPPPRRQVVHADSSDSDSDDDIMSFACPTLLMASCF